MHRATWMSTSGSAAGPLCGHFVNSSPTLFQQVLEQNGLDCPLLKRYNTNRESCIHEVSEMCDVDRDTSKELFIRITFLGSVEAWIVEHLGESTKRPPPSWTLEMRNEMEANARSLMSRDKFNVYDLGGHGPSNSAAAVRSSLALYLQTQERLCLDALRDIIVRNGFKCGALIYDGLGGQSPPGARSTHLHVVKT